MKAKYQILIAALMICPDVVTAQQPTLTDFANSISLTIEQVWEKTVINSKAVQIKKIQQNGSAELVKDAKAERLPELSIGGEYERVSNMPVYTDGLFHTPSQFPVLHDSYTVHSDAYLNIYNGNKTNLEIAERKTEHTIAGEQLNLTLSEAKLQAAAYFLDMKRSILFRDLLLKDIEAQEKQLVQLQQLKTNGVILKSDVLRAELKVSKQKLSLETLDNDIALANEKLNFLIGLPKEQRIIPLAGDTLKTLKPAPLDSYLADGGSKAYEVKISAQEASLKKLELKKVKSNYLPKVGLFGNYEYSYPQIFFYPYSPYAYSIGVAGIKATYSISSLWHNNHKTKAATLDYESQEIEHAQTQDKITQQIDEAYLRLNEALHRVEVSKVNILQATENKRIVTNTYFNQTSLITDLLDADTQLLQSRFDLVAAEIAARIQYYQLQNITGNL